MTTLANIVTATRDQELADLLAAAAAVSDVDAVDLSYWASSQIHRLVTQAVDGGTVASHHAAGTLTDDHLLEAVRAVAGVEEGP